MNIRTHRLAWALFFLTAGAFLLLNNHKVFRELGDGIWGGLFAAVGLGLLIWFLLDRQRTWRAIAGFPILTVGILLLLEWREVDLGVWRVALVMFGVALGFWAVLLSGNDNWWALIPGGVLTLMGVLIGLQARMDEAIWLAAFFLGLSAVFGLLYLLRLGQQDTGWAGVPAAAFLLIGIVTLVGASSPVGLIAQWWPLLLVIAGAIMLVLALHRSRRADLPPTASPAQAEQLPAAKPVTPVDEAPIDIYAVLAQQPKGDRPRE